MDKVPTTGSPSGLKPTREIGDWAEQTAADYLAEKGFRVISRNFTFGKSEIDLVAVKENLLVFFEVKMRSRLDYGHPSDAVTVKKVRMILNGVNGFLLKNPRYQSLDQRLDVISISRIREEVSIDHYENVTQMMSL